MRYFIFFISLLGCNFENQKQYLEQECDIVSYPDSSLKSIIESNSIYFVRYDGGPLEVEKGMITGWPYIKNPINKDVTDKLYSKPNQAVELLNRLNSNWIWVTWSNGFSIQTESKQWEELKCFIFEMHNAEINVTAYLSLSNIFWEDMFKNVPESKDWIRYKDDNTPLLYANKPGRYIADLTHSGYREYLLIRIRKAIEYGADAIYLDNIIFDNYLDVIDILVSIKQLFIELDKDMPIYVNTRHPEIIKYSDVLLSEGTVEPGYYDNESKYRDNTDKIKGLKQRVVELDIPIKIEHNSNKAGERREFVMTPEGYKRSLAEAWAYNTSFYFAPEGVTLTSIVKDTSEGKGIVKAIGDYNAFKQKKIPFWMGTKLIADSKGREIISVKNAEGEDQSDILVTISENNEYYYIQIVNYNDNPFSCLNITVNEDIFEYPYSGLILSSPDQNDSTLVNCNTLNEVISTHRFPIDNLNIYSVISLVKTI